ncbi:FAD-dependent oxidoreductase [Lentilactobacillus sp. SPB1-3]|uniref:FAD-dependent oxidoreductase n=1 Tax=Lentilactobacillus terminaliae TaxID=3003483 RepID=A0ACD5DG21_9LACO|nr:FAD-dependent oxidoreductase [Lentilactobacillus sp. SPB1-3]MCZ0976592.1 FAD-dependent oxidoreductase [Lentilactobacillus sp. SPB1-3]
MKVVIVGCTHTGIAAINEITKRYPDVEVVVYERHNNVSFLSSGVPLYLSGMVDKLETMCYSSPEELAKTGAKININHDVLKVDSETKTITVENLETRKIFTDAYDKLIMATGSYVPLPPIYGVDDSRVLLCKDYNQARAIHETAKNNHRIAIIGGGYVGVELAEGYTSTGHEVTIIQSNEQLLNNYVDPDTSDYVVNLLRENGADVRLGERCQSFENSEDTNEVVVETDKRAYNVDLAIVCTGFLANTDLLQGQVDMTREGAIIVDDYMRSSNPDIYAAGDASVQHFNPDDDNESYIPLATNAIRQGALAGINILGNVQKSMGTQATSALMIYGYTIASTGLTLRNALRKGLNATSVTWEDDYRPDYMPSTEKLTIKLVYDRDSRRVLGAQLISKYEVAQSANAISIVIQNRNTIDELAYIDMLYNPHYDQPFNYLNLVAQQAVDKELS